MSTVVTLYSNFVLLIQHNYFYLRLPACRNTVLSISRLTTFNLKILPSLHFSIFTCLLYSLPRYALQYHYFFFFIITSIVLCIVLAHRSIDAETSKPRQPQLLEYCLLSVEMFHFFIIYGCCFVKPIPVTRVKGKRLISHYVSCFLAQTISCIPS